MKTIVLLSICILLSLDLSSNTIYGAVNGDWDKGSTWVGGESPKNKDTVQIPAGLDVTIFTNTKTYKNLVLDVHGTLTVDNGAKLNLDEAGLVNVYSGGQIVAVNAGSKVNICDNTFIKGISSKNTAFPGPYSLNCAGLGGLPIELLIFTVKVVENNVFINWVTATETNNRLFTIEKSMDGIGFQTVGYVNGSGTTSSPRSYLFTDTQPLNGISYYRLKQTDYDGQSAYFNYTAVSLAEKKQAIIFPNPSAGKNISIQLTATQDELVTINVSDMMGKEIINKVIKAESGANVLELGQDLAKGDYFVKIINEEQASVLRLVVK